MKNYLLRFHVRSGGYSWQTVMATDPDHAIQLGKNIAEWTCGDLEFDYDYQLLDV
jgi:hypothetical protein